MDLTLHTLKRCSVFCLRVCDAKNIQMSLSIKEIFLGNSHVHTSISLIFFVIQGQVSDTAIKSAWPVNSKH